MEQKVSRSQFYRRYCYGLNSVTVLDLAAQLDHIGGFYGPYGVPTPFLCVFVKMKYLSPSNEILFEYLLSSNKYIRILAAILIRIQAFKTPALVYSILEPLLLDPRVINKRIHDGTFLKTHIDTVIDGLLHETRIFDIPLPPIPPRMSLVSKGILPPERYSPLREFGKKAFEQELLNPVPDMVDESSPLEIGMGCLPPAALQITGKEEPEVMRELHRLRPKMRLIVESGLLREAVGLPPLRLESEHLIELLNVPIWLIPWQKKRKQEEDKRKADELMVSSKKKVDMTSKTPRDDIEKAQKVEIGGKRATLETKIDKEVIKRRKKLGLCGELCTAVFNGNVDFFVGQSVIDILVTADSCRGKDIRGIEGQEHSHGHLGEASIDLDLVYGSIVDELMPAP
ncbi:Pre-mRNA-splicing factor 38 like protein [Aduncisulcus paluster]|uniref:Pre-mRNA-splicing factor 38 n=1 Tax=Aduncisulcus paluster TaxID=2918883 RepID=A0ABQ5K0C2_9EUKA|nr:Pre-mRNA-splicing factor 38 like protein [Aduncisulcus paluster]